MSDDEDIVNEVLKNSGAGTPAESPSTGSDSAIGDSISRKGKHSYYYAHGNNIGLKERPVVYHEPVSNTFCRHVTLSIYTAWLHPER
jgi:hypothetical protein